MNGKNRIAWVVGMVASIIFFAGCKTIQSKWQAQKLAAKPRSSEVVAEVKPKLDAKNAQIDMFLALAENHERHGDLAAAAKAYTQVLAMEDNLQANHRLALISFKLGDSERAWELLDKCLKIAPRDAELFADIGYLRYIDGDLEKAGEYTRKGLKIDSRSARLHNNLGVILVGLDRTDEALEEFALAGCSGPQAYSNLGHAYFVSDQIEKGEYYLKVAATSPKPCVKAAATLDTLAATRTKLASTTKQEAYSTR